MHLGVVITTENSPNVSEFYFIISSEKAIQASEVGMFIQISSDKNPITLGRIDSLQNNNKYFNSPELIHGSASGLAPPKIYPSKRWGYLIGMAKILGTWETNLHKKSTQPVEPGSMVSLVDPYIFNKFLGLKRDGLNIGKLKQMNFEISVPIDKLLQKHLSILSISGGGKSYATSILLEEILKRKKEQGRPSTVIFDVHGEYTYLKSIPDDKNFISSEVEIISADMLKIATGQLSAFDFLKMQPSMSQPQIRELGKIISRLKIKKEIITIPSIIASIKSTSMNPLVQDTLVSWLEQLKSLNLFSYYSNPLLKKALKSGKLLIIDMSSLISLKKKQVILLTMLKEMFRLRRAKEIPPSIVFIEEAHQFCPEHSNSVAKHIIETVAREGRKFFLNLVLITQRPSNLSATALSAM